MVSAISELAGRAGSMSHAFAFSVRLTSPRRCLTHERRGREHVWALNPERLAAAERHLKVITRGWDDVLARLKVHAEPA